jgi:hypothetical protein
VPFFDTLRSALGFNAKAATAKTSYATGPYGRVRVQMDRLGGDPRSGAKMLRSFSRNCVPLRTAYNRRKQQISQAKWRVIRLDDPKAEANPAVVAAVTKLLRTVNPKGESFRSLLDQVMEDYLTLDAGCIEKEKTFGGAVKWLWAVDGATIVPDPDWDGTDPGAARYFQYVDGRKVAELRNDQLVYIMGTPTTYSPIGWSRTETLVRAIEAILYGDQYDYEMLRQTAPAGILDLGRGLQAEQVQAYREYYENEIAGGKDIAIFGGGEVGPGSGVTFTPFQRSARDMERASYREWLVKMVAMVFEMDPTIFGITGDVNKSASKTLQVRTDEGHVADANLIAEFIEREIISEFDENHGFEFEDLNARDEMAQAKIDQIYSSIGVETPNSILVREGRDKVPWGEQPYAATQSQFAGDEPDSGEADDAPENSASGSGSGKSAAPFAGKARTRFASATFTPRFTRSWHRSSTGSTPPSPS